MWLTWERAGKNLSSARWLGVFSWDYDYYGSRKVAVGIATGLWAEASAVRIPVVTRDFSLLLNLHTHAHTHTHTHTGADSTPLSFRTRNLLSELKRRGCGFEYCPSSVEVWNECSCTLTLPSITSYCRQRQLHLNLCLLKYFILFFTYLTLWSLEFVQMALINPVYTSQNGAWGSIVLKALRY